MLWRPKRSRLIPFYSDASHNDPERIIVSWGENMACFFMPLVALVEYMQQSRLADSVGRPIAPPMLRCLVPARVSTHNVVLLNFVFTAATTMFFFTTANVPSKFPYTTVHQFAASALIFTYAVQATLKAILAHTFGNYDANSAVFQADDEEGDEDRIEKSISSSELRVWRHGNQWLQWWDRHHMKVRLMITGALWMTLIVTWVCYVGRVTVKPWGSAYHPLRRNLSLMMAIVVHIATVSCVLLMVVMGIDMRGDRIVLGSRAA